MGKSVITREYYAHKLDAWLGKRQIIVLTGQRRVGKSFVLRDFINRHIADDKANIIYVNKEKKEFDNIKTSSELNEYIDSRLQQTGTITFSLTRYRKSTAGRRVSEVTVLRITRTLLLLAAIPRCFPENLGR